MAIVSVTGTYGGGKTGTVTFFALPGGEPTMVTLAADTSIVASLRATDVSPGLTDYFVVENLSSGENTYTLSLPSSDAGFDVVTSVATPAVTLPHETLIVGPATGTFTDITGVYQIPAAASMIYFEAVAGAGGGAAGGNASTTTMNGGGGGGGGGRTCKWVSAAALRAQYPTGIPYTVGYGGAGAAKNTAYGTQGADGLAGGYTYVGDFCVATPGNLYGQALGGGGGGATAAFGGSAGLGDTQGAVGGTGGVQWQFYLLGTSADGTGGGGGYPGFLLGGGETIYVAQVQAAGGGGGGGGGGGVLSGVAYNGGNSGFAITSDPSALVGLGGVVGGALPTTAGVPVGVNVSTQGGGGGGAAALTGDAQAGASALPGSGSGGGGGGSGQGSAGGAGGNGGSGFLRILAI